MKKEKDMCPYYDTCGQSDCSKKCFIKEMFDDFYLLEEKYFELEKKLKIANEKLEKVKPILDGYAKTTIGELMPDGRYRFPLENKHFLVNMLARTDYAKVYYNPFYAYYDPKPAQRGIKIIEE